MDCVCKGCGKDFRVSPSVIRKGGGKYCSRACTKKGENRECPTCGSQFYVKNAEIKRGYGTYCSRECANPARGLSGENHPQWKGGKYKHGDGYIMVRVGTDKYELEHRVVMANHLGRELKTHEHVHHINGVKDDNRIENLELTTASQHTKEHHAPKKDLSTWMAVACLSCGNVFAERKKKVERNPNCFCNRDCYIAGKKKRVVQ